MSVPDSISMSAYMSNPAVEHSNMVYSLIGVVSHVGSLNGGHYKAQCCSANNNRWYSCDDAIVGEVGLIGGGKPSAEPYLLLYRLQE